MRQRMSVNDLVLVQGMDDTKLALRRWNEHPWRDAAARGRRSAC